MTTTMKPKLSRRGQRILESALKAMSARPDTFNMDDWILHDRSVKPSKKVGAPYCGTVACLAGHITLAVTKKLPRNDCGEYSIRQLPMWLAKKTKTAVINELRACGCSYCTDDQKQKLRRIDAADVAIAALELKDQGDAKNKLFYTNGWPNQFASSLAEEKNPKERVAIAIRRVRHWLKTGE